MSLNSNLLPTISYNDLTDKPNIIPFASGGTGDHAFSIPVKITGTSDRLSLLLQICNQNGSIGIYSYTLRGGSCWKTTVVQNGVTISSESYDNTNGTLTIELSSGSQWGTWFAIGNAVR